MWPSGHCCFNGEVFSLLLPPPAGGKIKFCLCLGMSLLLQCRGHKCASTFVYQSQLWLTQPITSAPLCYKLLFVYTQQSCYHKQTSDDILANKTYTNQSCVYRKCSTMLSCAVHHRSPTRTIGAHESQTMGCCLQTAVWF